MFVDQDMNIVHDDSVIELVLVKDLNSHVV
jgi:hypothetical protein